MGMDASAIKNAYATTNHYLRLRNFNEAMEWCAPVAAEVEKALTDLRLEKNAYHELDRSVLLAILASRQTLATIDLAQKRVGVNIGSSRGATETLEQAFEQFQAKGAKHIPTKTSPSTTLGNISSWVGQDLKLKGIHLEHSITCSTALHAVLNGIAWLQADMADAFLVGGSEAPLTDFTVGQMKALRIYTSNEENAYPCRGVDYDNKKNTMVLGEAAGTFLLEKNPEHAQAYISGWGFASEKITTNTSIDAKGMGFQLSMQQALNKAGCKPSDIDALVMHAPGTFKGDTAEFEAVKTVFAGSLPLMTGNKWKLGHSFGASGALSMELAMLMLQEERFIKTPFCSGTYPQKIEKVMVNAMGFGGNAVSLILEC